MALGIGECLQPAAFCASLSTRHVYVAGAGKSGHNIQHVSDTRPRVVLTTTNVRLFLPTYTPVVCRFDLAEGARNRSRGISAPGFCFRRLPRHGNRHAELRVAERYLTSVILQVPDL